MGATDYSMSSGEKAMGLGENVLNMFTAFLDLLVGGLVPGIQDLILQLALHPQVGTQVTSAQPTTTLLSKATVDSLGMAWTFGHEATLTLALHSLFLSSPAMPSRRPGRSDGEG